MDNRSKQKPTPINEESKILLNAIKYHRQESHYKTAKLLRSERNALPESKDLHCAPVEAKFNKKANVGTHLIMVSELIDILASQECLFGNPVLHVDSDVAEGFSMIERSEGSEDHSVVCSKEEFASGIDLATLLARLRDVERDGLDDSYINLENAGNRDWELYFIDQEEGKILCISSNEMSRSDI